MQNGGTTLTTPDDEEEADDNDQRDTVSFDETAEKFSEVLATIPFKGEDTYAAKIDADESDEQSEALLTTAHVHQASSALNPTSVSATADNGTEAATIFNASPPPLTTGMNGDAPYPNPSANELLIAHLPLTHAAPFRFIAKDTWMRVCYTWATEKRFRERQLWDVVDPAPGTRIYILYDETILPDERMTNPRDPRWEICGRKGLNSIFRYKHSSKTGTASFTFPNKAFQLCETLYDKLLFCNWWLYLSKSEHKEKTKQIKANAMDVAVPTPTLRFRLRAQEDSLIMSVHRAAQSRFQMQHFRQLRQCYCRWSCRT
ncbi:hypothetical protein MPSEU_000732500 [Mayamaea pseudoterrestris]|nr:hypothetical protein MPSEU_000732500 [Mayamaea pseudoterrestris]